MKKKSSRIHINSFGLSTLVVVFFSLCLVVFAVLSFTTAKNDFNHSMTAADHRTEYYEACNISEEIIARLCTKGDAGLDSWLESRNLKTEIRHNGSSYHWSVPVGDRQSLDVEVVIYNGSCDITKWKTVSKGGSNET